MTIGLALATWRPFLTEPMVLIAADSRVSSHSRIVTDAGVKTYDVGQRLAMVSCGSALPPITAAEIVRPIIDAHNRARTETPLSFFDSVRTLAFFIDRVASESNLTGESVAVGFFRSGDALIVPGNDVHSLRYDLGDFVANDEPFKTHDDPPGF